MALFFKVDVKIGDVESPIFPRAVFSEASLALGGRSANWFAVGSQAFPVKNVGDLEELFCPLGSMLLKRLPQSWRHAGLFPLRNLAMRDRSVGAKRVFRGSRIASSWHR